mgnify:CR=1 FL=1
MYFFLKLIFSLIDTLISGLRHTYKQTVLDIYQLVDIKMRGLADQLNTQQEGNVDPALKPDLYIFFFLFFNTNKCFPTI